MTWTLLLLLLSLAHGAYAQTASSPSLETWEIALIAGSGTLVVLMCGYGAFALVRRRRYQAEATRRRATLTKVSVVRPPRPAPPRRSSAPPRARRGV